MVNPTHTLTHTRKWAERFREYRRGGKVSSPAFCVLFCLHHLCHEAAYSLCGFLLLLPGGVGVGTESEPRVIVSQHTADRFHVHAVLQRQRREGMPLRYNYDKPEKPRISRVFGYPARFFILFQTEKSSREVMIF